MFAINASATDLLSATAMASPQMSPAVKWMVPFCQKVAHHLFFCMHNMNFLLALLITTLMASVSSFDLARKTAKPLTMLPKLFAQHSSLTKWSLVGSINITSLACLCFLPLTHGAVIEVTAGGTVSEPTYQFSDSSGTQLATLKYDTSNNKIQLQRSGGTTDLELLDSGGTSLGSLNTLITQMALVRSYVGHKIITVSGAGETHLNGHYFMTGFSNADCRWDSPGSTGWHMCKCIDCTDSGGNPCTDPPKLFKAGSSSGTYWRMYGCGLSTEYKAICDTSNPADSFCTWTLQNSAALPLPTVTQETSFDNAGVAATSLASA